MPRYDSPYTIMDARPETSTYTLDIPNSSNIFLTIHVSQLRPYHTNNAALFLSRKHPRPVPIVTEDGQSEIFTNNVIDERKVGRGSRYLARWVGLSEDDEWLPRRDLEDWVWEKERSGRWLGVFGLVLLILVYLSVHMSISYLLLCVSFHLFLSCISSGNCERPHPS